MNKPTPPGQDPKPLTNRDIWALIMATYRSSFPYVLIFVAGILFATWLFTEVLFG